MLSSPAASGVDLRYPIRNMFASPGPIIFQLGPLALRWYGLITAVVTVAALWLFERHARAEDLPPDDMVSCAV